MSELAICARGVEKRFGAVVALRGLDLEVPIGSLHAIVGPNGAGKSTFLRILAGLAHPSRGEVRLANAAGERREPSKSRDRVGYVGHATLLYPELSARENLLFAARLYGLPDANERAERLLAEEGLLDVAERRAGGFSRGMAQRLSIARALVHEPELVLLDEPFTGLDRPARDRLAARVKRLRDEGRTLVMITHELALAGEIGDRVHFLVRGRAAGSHTGEALASEPLERAYLAAVNAESGAAKVRA